MTPTEARAALLRIAANLVGGRYLGELSPYPDDMPRTTPVRVLREIEALDGRLRVAGISVRDALKVLEADALIREARK